MALSMEGSNSHSSNLCHQCLSAFKWVPVLFITCIAVWSYYAYVIQLCFMTVETAVEKVFFLLGYHVLFIIFMWTYYQTIFSRKGRVPDQFKIARGDWLKMQQAESDEARNQILIQISQNLPITMRTVTCSIRYCDKCAHIKPDRAHHCSVCGMCVLKMDHHCPWVNNCVAFTNYKFFILFLGYALLYCIFIALTSLSYFIKFWKGDLEGMGRFHILFLFFVAMMFAVSLISLFGYHIYLVLHNRSTLEAFRAPIFRSGPDKDGYSLGKYNNFQEVFGDNKKLWFLPVFSSLGDGVSYPVRAQHQPSSYDSMGSTQNSLGDGISFPERLVDEDRDGLLNEHQRWTQEDEPDTPPFSSSSPSSRQVFKMDSRSVSIPIIDRQYTVKNGKLIRFK